MPMSPLVVKSNAANGHGTENVKPTPNSCTSNAAKVVEFVLQMPWNLWFVKMLCLSARNGPVMDFGKSLLSKSDGEIRSFLRCSLLSLSTCFIAYSPVSPHHIASEPGKR